MLNKYILLLLIINSNNDYTNKFLWKHYNINLSGIVEKLFKHCLRIICYPECNDLTH